MLLLIRFINLSESVADFLRNVKRGVWRWDRRPAPTGPRPAPGRSAPHPAPEHPPIVPLRAAFHGLRWCELDPSGWLILGLERVGLAWDVVTAAPERARAELKSGTVSV